MINQDLKIRKLVHKDRVGVENILSQINNFNKEEFDCAKELMDVYFSEDEKGGYLFYCAIDEKDEPIGYVCFGPTPLASGVFDIYWIAVDPKKQNYGVGTKLIEFVENELEKLGARMILIETSSRADYKEVNNFYLGRGYSEVSKIEDFYSFGDHRITYCKRFS